MWLRLTAFGVWLCWESWLPIYSERILRQGVDWLRLEGVSSALARRGSIYFFVLSGFLITGILFDSLRDTAYFRRFYVRRALRIFPLYYGVILLLLALTPWLGIVWHGVQWTLLFYLQNTSLAIPIGDFKLPHGLDLEHFWSLAVEEQFYLVWPLAVFLIRDRKRLLGWCLAFSVFALTLRLFLEFHGTAYKFINTGTLCRADSLLIGAALALLIRGPEKEATLAWCLVPRSIAADIFETRWLRGFGNYSYGLYVTHMVILGVLLGIFRRWVRHLTSQPSVIILVGGMLVFGASVLLAYASYHLYEKPFLKLKRYFNYDQPERIPVAAHAASDAAPPEPGPDRMLVLNGPCNPLP